jgi:hypothetical protein
MPGTRRRPVDASPERGPAAPKDETETAAEDLLIERPDLGPGCATLVSAGDPIPPALAHLPRRSRKEAST